MATRTALLNVNTYPFALDVKDEARNVLVTLSVTPVPHESIDTTVRRALKRAGYTVLGDFETDQGDPVFRIRQIKA